MLENKNVAPPVDDETDQETGTTITPEPVDPGSINSQPQDQQEVDNWVSDHKSGNNS